MRFKKFNIIPKPRRENMEHRFSGSYLLKPYGADHRKYIKLLSKKILKSTSDWAGFHIWCSPVVPLAPPSIQFLK